MDAELARRFEEENPHLAALFRDLRGKSVKYFPNQGNAGDSLIAAATYQLLNYYGLDYDVLSTPEDATRLRSETVLLGGGGNLVPFYSGMATLITRLHPGNNRMIVLPHSIRGNEDLLTALPPSTSIYCREIASWNHVQAYAGQCDVVLGHDLALYTDVEPLRLSTQSIGIESRFRTLLLDETKLTPEMLSGAELSCMRHGVERTSIPDGPNYDVSVVFRTGVSPGKAELGSWMLLEFARLAAEITTNRLHIGIASALTGTKTLLHDNSYGKVSGVFTHSMERRFPHVSFEGEHHSSATSTLPLNLNASPLGRSA